VLSELKSLALGLSVLYVEDEDGLRETMGQYLGKLFSKVVSCANGQEGLDAFNDEEFDLIITDLQMPKIDGVKMVKAIKSIKPHQEILITSAYTETSYFLECIRHGVSGYIIKPIDFDQLNSELYKVLTKVVALKENVSYRNSLEALVKERTQETLDLLQQQIENHQKTLQALVELIEDRDTYTGGHSQRVANYCIKIAKAMGYDTKTCDLLYRAAILHDIGKISTPDSILLKPGSLNDAEYKLIQDHVCVGYEVLRKIPMFEELAQIVYSHHERYDGKGYPRGLKGDEIIPLARIMILADAFDAMTTNRIYRARKSAQEALKEIELQSSKQFDPVVVQVALEVLKNIDLEDYIHQFPQTETEKERFSYFFRDSLTGAYNTRYLDLILMHNGKDCNYRYIYGFFLENFTAYNKAHGWDNGDKFLEKFAAVLMAFFPKALVFRYHGDDFLLLSDGPLEDIGPSVLFEEIKGSGVSVFTHTIDLCKTPMKNLKEIEKEFI
jgi:putative nucleotidyltransferase with HDIG domain